jgi:hypothetical protein
MPKNLKLSAEEILQIDYQNPEKLFSLDNFTKEFFRLRKKWHPDYNTDPQANAVFQHLMLMAETAKSRIVSNTWNGKAALQYTTTSDNKTFRFNYRALREFELGKMYIGKKHVIYVIDGKNKDLYDNGVKAIKGIKYSDKNLENQFKPLLPKIVQASEADIGCVLVIEKPKGAVLLQELIDFLPDNTLPPKHTAWVISSMYNIGMFLNQAGITHNSILASTIFVDPKEHACYLLGGWWYSVKQDTKLKAVPAELIKTLPKKLFADKLARTCYDRQAIKAVGINCLGDSTLGGSKLLFNKDVPKQIVHWLRTPSLDSAFDEYDGWINALEDSYGERKFTEFTIDISQIT